ncbi:MAG: response regulator transcription factor [Armatimonadetes bacterium]|nr:response regulator transcription factor [Armatimonadota bacterium]
MTPSGLLRAVIADDEAGARWHLRGLLEDCRVRTVAECATGAEVLPAVGRTSPDLLCLDVRLPDFDGLEVARRLEPGARPAVVFATGYADYAAAAFDLDAADYLVKPLTAARVREAIQRVWARLQRTRGEAPVARIFVPAGDHRLALAPQAIRFVEARDGVCLMHADDGIHPVRAPLAQIERLLAPHGFLRTHRAYLVNLHRVRALVPWSRHVQSLLLDDEKETHVPVAKSRLAAFRRSVIWITRTGGSPHASGAWRPGGDRGRLQPGVGPGDR